MTTSNFRVRVHDSNARTQVADYFRQLIKYQPSQQNIVFICIGTDRSTGDSLGPLVGTFLERAFLPNVYVYGTLEQPVHALNLKNYLHTISEEHADAKVVAIDACLGKPKSIGYIELGVGSIRPGAGVNKDLPAVGDYHITGIVNVSGFMEYMVLQNTRLNVVMKMAETISYAIQDVCFANSQFPSLLQKPNHSFLSQKR
ncbi:spore protease YyaC [Risungbinella massiliensis]|uniref:spore protease YyaC n=1 Tax=Risungbinella massiliensis TaxID=1329796 RepID=UPI0005CC31D3|nr:spore protease YyaC [Risungbinella massiliensis]